MTGVTSATGATYVSRMTEYRDATPGLLPVGALLLAGTGYPQRPGKAGWHDDVVGGQVVY